MARFEGKQVKDGVRERWDAVVRAGLGPAPHLMGEGEELPGRDFLPRLGAGALVLIGVAIALLGLSTGGGLSGACFSLLLGGGFLAAGIFWYNYVAVQERTRRELLEEKYLLSVALRHGGYATLAQIALETPFTAAQAEGAMARLCRQGLAHPELLGDGTVSYRFGGLLGE